MWVGLFVFLQLQLAFVSFSSTFSQKLCSMHFLSDLNYTVFYSVSFAEIEGLRVGSWPTQIPSSQGSPGERPDRKTAR